MKRTQLGMSTLAVVLIIILIVVLLGGLPLGWPMYGPQGLLVLALLVVIILAVMGKL